MNNYPFKQLAGLQKNS